MLLMGALPAVRHCPALEAEDVGVLPPGETSPLEACRRSEFVRVD